MIMENGQEVSEPVNNRIIGNPELVNKSQILFQGKNCILFVEDNVKLSDSTIKFCGDGAVVYLSGNTKHPYRINLTMWRGTTAYFGQNSYFNGAMTAIISERKNLIVGSEGVFSFDIWIRTADPHLIYDIENKKRINPSKSVVIGDHVWLGQSVMILKGSRIGSGSIIAARSVLANKKVGSNTIYAGNPARMIKENVFFLGDSVHNYTAKKTKKSMKCEDDQFIYRNEGLFDLKQYESMLDKAEDEDVRLRIIQESLAVCDNRNRFYQETVAAKKPFWKRIMG